MSTLSTCVNLSLLGESRLTVIGHDLRSHEPSGPLHHPPCFCSRRCSCRRQVSLLGFPANKLVLGLPFYAKWITTKKGYTCTQAIGCPTELLENPDGSDTGKSGSMTFEAANFAAPPTNLTTTPDATCGAGTFFKCAEGSCCGGSGWW